MEQLKKTLMLYRCNDLINALNELKDNGINGSYIAIKAITEYIKKYYPEIAQKYNL